MIHYAIPLQYILTLVLRFISILSTSLITNIKLIWKYFQKAGINFCNTIFFIWHSPFNTEASENISEEVPFLQLSLPVTPKLQASRTAFWVVVTLTSRQSSSRDQLFAWATYCLVAVIYASGTNRPPRHTWMFYLRRKNIGEKSISAAVLINDYHIYLSNLFTLKCSCYYWNSNTVITV